MNIERNVNAAALICRRFLEELLTSRVAVGNGPALCENGIELRHGRLDY